MHLVALPETLEIMRSIEPPKARSFPDSDKRLRIIAYSASSAKTPSMTRNAAPAAVAVSIGCSVASA